MRAPFGGRGLKKCCFCCDLDPDYTCYLIGAICISVIGFGGLSSLVFRTWPHILVTLFSFVYYVADGIILILGTLYMNKAAKLVYCWMTLFGIALLIIVIIVFIWAVAEGHTFYFEFPEDCKNCMASIYISFCISWLFNLFWDIYTPLVVLGNMETYRVATRDFSN